MTTISQPRAALFTALAVLGLLGVGVSALVFSIFPLAFGLGCAPLFVLPEVVAAGRDPLGRTACALAVLGCWLAASCWMLAISFGAAYTTDAISTVGVEMRWSALVDWHTELAKQPGLVCLVLGLMSWPGALEVACRLRPGGARFVVHGFGLLPVAVIATVWLSAVHRHLGGPGWSRSSGVFVVFAIPGAEGLWFVAMLAMLVVSAAVVQAIRFATALGRARAPLRGEDLASR